MNINFTITPIIANKTKGCQRISEN